MGLINLDWGSDWLVSFLNKLMQTTARAATIEDGAGSGGHMLFWKAAHALRITLKGWPRSVGFFARGRLVRKDET